MLIGRKRLDRVSALAEALRTKGFTARRMSPEDVANLGDAIAKNLRLPEESVLAVRRSIMELVGQELTNELLTQTCMKVVLGVERLRRGLPLGELHVTDDTVTLLSG